MKAVIQRVLVTALLIMVAFLLQNNIFAAIPLVNTTPNLLLLVTISLGLLHGQVSGLLVGFFAGLLLDIFGGDVLGQYALILGLLGYGCGFFNPYFYMDSLLLPLGACAVAELFYGMYIYVFGFLLRGRFDIGYYFGRIILPETIYTMIVLVVVYRFLMFVNRRLELASKRRSTEHFV